MVYILINQSLIRFAYITTLFCIMLGCSGSCSPPDELAFQHDVTGQVLPWTNEDFDAADDKFTFAVFSDLTGGEREQVFEIAVAQLSLLRPELIISVGDLIEGGTVDLGEIAEQWDWFDERAGRTAAPVFYVGGNHDLTGEVLQRVWDERYGRRYYHFVYKNVLFLVLDTEDNPPERMQEVFEARNEAIEIMNSEGLEAFKTTKYANMPERSAGTISPEQSAYFRQVIANNAAVRWTFLFMHKPAWTKQNEENFTAIEAALADQPFTVFHGHVHAYDYEERNGRDYIRLATTGGVQLPEHGRSADRVTLVTVDDQGADVANLLMSGILDKTGHIPLDGDDVCFELEACGQDP
jgi:3',5'-cyclic AMP phosphodiesterase CpdA